MSGLKIKVDLHESGHGFQIVVDGPGMHQAYPEPVEDIKDALGMAFTLRDMIETNCGIQMADRDVVFTQRAIESNALDTPGNMELYRKMMTGRIKPME